MPVYNIPKEFAAEVPRFNPQEPYEELMKAEEAFLARLVTWAKERARPDPCAGEVVRWQVADGYAQYLVAATKPVQLIHLPFGDGYQAPLAHRATKKDIVALIESEKAFAALVERNKATGPAPAPVAAPVAQAAPLLKFTVIAEYWANEKGLCRHVEATDDDHAVRLVEAQVVADRLKERQTAQKRGWGVPEDMKPAVEEEGDEDEEDSLLRIWAVLPGWVTPVYLRD